MEAEAFGNFPPPLCLSLVHLPLCSLWEGTFQENPKGRGEGSYAETRDTVPGKLGMEGRERDMSASLPLCCIYLTNQESKH